MFFHTVGAEGPSTDAYTWTASYTNFTPVGTTGGLDDSNIHITGEQRILTGTGDSVDATSTTADRDYAQIYVALAEVSAPGPVFEFMNTQAY